MKNKVVVFGAGKSSRHLILYLADLSEKMPFDLIVLDIDISNIPSVIATHKQIQLVQIDKNEPNPYDKYIAESFVAISMLPPFMHVDIAKICLKHNTHLITPSYVSDEMKALDNEAKEKNLIFLNEVGFDPGIDHMIAMKVYHDIENEGGQLYSYRSFVGGLVAPESDTNPWKYKFTWSPRNVILAGQGGTSQYIQGGVKKYIPYYSLFSRSETLTLSNGSRFEVYPNRDSLKYETIYNWTKLDTILRGTMRRDGFCTSWHYLVQMGLTDDSFQLNNVEQLTYCQFYYQFYPTSPTLSERESLANFLNIEQDSDNFKRLEFIGFFDEELKINIQGSASPAIILQSILEDKWKMESTDIDQSVMVHLFEYKVKEKKYLIETTLIVNGLSSTLTSMSQLVGLPIAISCEMILKNEIAQRGVILPIYSDIYNPILNQLDRLGVQYVETKKEI